MIDVSIKITLLSVTSLLSSMVLIAFRAQSYFLWWESPIDIAHGYWYQLDTMISCICLTLFLPKTKNAYNKLCCCCKNALSRCMRERIHNTTMQI